MFFEHMILLLSMFLFCRISAYCKHLNADLGLCRNAQIYGDNTILL